MKKIKTLFAERSAVSLVEALVLVVLLSTIGLVAISTLIHFTYSSLRSEGYQQRSAALESLFGFAASSIPASTGQALGLGSRLSAGTLTYRQEVQADNPRVYYPFDDRCQQEIITPLLLGTSSGGSPQRPAGIIAGAHGGWYLADSGNNRLQLYNDSGQYQRQLANSGSGNGQVNDPRGLARDDQGNIYLTDSGNNRIQKFSASGQYLSKFGSAGSDDGQFNSPAAIARDDQGNIYVADTGNNRIQKFSASGQYLSKFGSAGSDDGQFNSPAGIARDDQGNIYVTDTGNNRIQKFSASGQYLSKFGSAGSGDGQFNAPRGITIDPQGNIYVTDSGNNRLQRFTSNGSFSAKWGGPGSASTQFNAPSALALSPDGQLAVADSNNNRFSLWAASGCPNDTVVANAASTPPPFGAVGISGLDGRITRSGSQLGFQLQQPSLLYEHFQQRDGQANSFGQNSALRFWPRGAAEQESASAFIRANGSGAPENFNLNRNSFTIELWATTEGPATLLARTSASSGNSYALRFDSQQRLELKAGTTTLAISRQPLPAGDNYLAVTGNNGQINFYLNGQEIAVDTPAAASAAFPSLGNSGWLQISADGTDSPAEFSNGALDEVAIYPQALSEERIEAHYRAAARQARGTNGGGDDSSNVQPLSLSGDQLLFRGKEGVCYRLMFRRAAQEISVASYSPTDSADSGCAVIAPRRGPNQSSGPSDPVLDNLGATLASQPFNYQVLARGVEELSGKTPFSYYNPQGQEIAVDRQASSESNNVIYQQLSADGLSAVEINTAVSGQAADIFAPARVPSSQFEQRYYLDLLCPRE